VTDAAGLTDTARLEAVIHGRVQGVGFRIFVARQARRQGLTGWVANEASGRVRCVAEGERQALEAFLDELRDGPPGAWVDRVDADWGPSTGSFRDFDIRSGWHPGD
jgi:acylphosphatase